MLQNHCCGSRSRCCRVEAEARAAREGGDVGPWPSGCSWLRVVDEDGVEVDAPPSTVESVLPSPSGRGCSSGAVGVRRRPRPRPRPSLAASPKLSSASTAVRDARAPPEPLMEPTRSATLAATSRARRSPGRTRNETARPGSETAEAESETAEAPAAARASPQIVHVTRACKWQPEETMYARVSGPPNSSKSHARSDGRTAAVAVVEA